MRLFEYEGKEMLRKAGFSVPQGGVVRSSEEAVRTANGIGYPVMIKLQLLSGSRGKAGAIRSADSEDEVKESARALLGLGLGSSVLVETKLDIAKAFYLSFSVDCQSGSLVMMASAFGGMDVEEMVLQNPDTMAIQKVDLWRGLRIYQVRQAFEDWGLTSGQFKQACILTLVLYHSFRDNEASLVEINPLVLTNSGNLVAADAKVIIDDNAVFRHQGFITSMEERYPDELELKAAIAGLNYVKLAGNIGLLCTGAGLTLTTVDLIEKYGGKAANFLESGGSNYSNAHRGLEIVLSDPDVKVLLINTFGLVSRSDVICRGLADVLKELKPDIPIIASIRGTGEEIAWEIFKDELGIDPFTNVEEAVREAVREAQKMVG